MKVNEKQVICIPARAGSKRVKAKNLRDFCGKPLISHAIEKSKLLFPNQNIYVNSDSADIQQLARASGVRSYIRDVELASDTATGDDFMMDFICNVEADTCIMINPVCPLITVQDIKLAVQAYERDDCDTLISCSNTQMQTFCDGHPVNLDISEKLKPTQQNPIISILNWGITIWDTEMFKERYQNGSAYIGHKRLLFEIEPFHSIKISNESDFLFAEKAFRSLQN